MGNIIKGSSAPVNHESIRLVRKTLSPESTIGEMYGPDGFFWCHTLEDVVRNFKIYGKTAIPAGKYEITWTWWEKHKKMAPLLNNVPFYTGILIHGGANALHTEGCIIVGNKKDHAPDQLFNSVDVVPEIYSKIRKLTDKGKLFIEIQGGFEPEFWIKSPHDLAVA